MSTEIIRGVLAARVRDMYFCVVVFYASSGKYRPGWPWLWQRFDKFRKTNKGYRHLPESLWPAAVKLAQTPGINRTANILRRDYSGLQKRLASDGKRV
ncbi:MAG: hypothetical protein ISS77_02850 [Phycisphaerae bacterium]|nr:hypothetical protein [Phycisphaerae bacterium]